MSTPKTIVLRGDGLRSEGPAGATITPGMLVELNSSGEVIPHGTAGGDAPPNVAVENELLGDGIDVDYAATENVLYDTLQNGAWVYGFLSAGTVAIGGQVESAGDGTFRAITTGTAVGTAMEAKVGGASTRCKIQLKG